MTDKRYFALIGEDGYVYPAFFDSENEDKEIDVDVVVDLLNENEQLKFQLDECQNHKLFSRRELEEENEQLKHNNKMLSMKMSEVSVKYRLLKEFSDDINPNEAVETVLQELMMITKEYR